MSCLRRCVFKILGVLLIIFLLSQVWQCADLFCSKAMTCSKAIVVESGSEFDLQDALYNNGPIR